MTTAPAVVWRYAPQVVRDYLTTVLDPAIRVATNVPANRPTLLVTISTASANGGGNIALSPRRVILHCYHPNAAAAGNLAETGFGHMLSARFTPGNGIYNVVVVGTPARFDDPDDSTPRFQMTLDILLRATR